MESIKKMTRKELKRRLWKCERARYYEKGQANAKKKYLEFLEMNNKVMIFFWSKEWIKFFTRELERELMM